MRGTMAMSSTYINTPQHIREATTRQRREQDVPGHQPGRAQKSPGKFHRHPIRGFYQRPGVLLPKPFPVIHLPARVNFEGGAVADFPLDAGSRRGRVRDSETKKT